MAKVAVGKKVPAFKAAATGSGSGSIASKDLLGAPYVLYFYPKDDTPGCTMEGHQFRDRYHAFKRHKVRILGVSRDTVASHEKFKAKHGLPFDLLSDPDEALCQQFDVMKLKNMYGKKVRGIERSTFLVDAEGVLRNEWRKVKVDGHADAVLAAAESL
ncbi:MAG TPA: peroxiredoxin [Gammaproteobacteria bacterium]|nr:peroxiredoxin [Gammaproteobacteria bacterium]